MTEERDLGSQPLVLLLESWGLSNHDLVAASPEQLTHKQVQRACQGRKLTLKMKQKLARTLNFAVWGRLTNDEREEFSEYFPKHLFNYSKGYEKGLSDINAGVLLNIGERKLRRDFKEELGIE
ncbi:MAG: hypothetical protein L7U83_04175 [Akkermansiaceae bacterium]|nr:hypothetical protein [Akkermansiaceae bacterium]